MTSYQQRLRAFMDRAFGRYRRLTPGQVELSAMRVLQQLRKNPEWQWQTRPSDLSPASKTSGAPDAAPRSRRLAVTVAVAATLLAVIAVPVIRETVSRRGAIATVEMSDGSFCRVAADETAAPKDDARVASGDVVRSDDGPGCTLALADGSKVEMRARAELSLERADDGVRIRLRTGSIIVTAAKQRDGHLYVQTKDVTVFVVGTVFLVSAEEDGSRVAVVEGVVSVREKDTETSLRSGEQVSTSPALEKRAVQDEIAWSRNVKRHLSLLAVSTSVIAQRAAPATPPDSAGGATQSGGGTPPTAAAPPAGRGGDPNITIGAPCCLVAPPPPRPQLQGGGAISGVVTDASTGAPLEGARVSLGGGGTPGQPSGRTSLLTDSKGRFIFPNLPASPPTTAFLLSAVRPGYLPGGYRRAPGMDPDSFRLVDGEWLREANIKLWRFGSISGTVRDERGEPFVGVPIALLRSTTIAGRLRWASGLVAETDDRGMYRFDDLSPGRYVVHVPSVQISLPSGQVALFDQTAYAFTGRPREVFNVLRGTDGSGVIAGLFVDTPPDDKGSVYTSVLHPAARSVDQAEPIAITSGANRTGVDIQLTPVPSVSVSGTLAGAADRVAGTPVRIIHAGNEQLGLAADAGLTRADGSGRFTFQRIPAGDYVIIASRSASEYKYERDPTGKLLPEGSNPFVVGSNNPVTLRDGVRLDTMVTRDPDVTGRLAVSVGNRPISGLVVPITPAVSVSGYFEWDGSEPTPEGLSRSLPVVDLEPADGDITTGSSRVYARPNPAGTTYFTLEDIKAGRYMFRVESSSGGATASAYRLVAATWNGRDILSTPLEVTGDGPVTGVVLRMSSQINKVTGTVRATDGRVATEGGVIVFPPAPRALLESGISAIRFRMASIAADGTYEVPPMIPGDYLIAAISTDDRARWLEPDFMASVARQATRISLGLASILSQDLRVTNTTGGAR